MRILKAFGAGRVETITISVGRKSILYLEITKRTLGFGALGGMVLRVGEWLVHRLEGWFEVKRNTISSPRVFISRFSIGPVRLVMRMLVT